MQSVFPSAPRGSQECLSTASIPWPPAGTPWLSSCGTQFQHITRGSSHACGHLSFSPNLTNFLFKSMPPFFLFFLCIWQTLSLSLSDFISPSDPHLSEVCVDSNLHVASPSATKKILISAWYIIYRQKTLSPCQKLFSRLTSIPSSRNHLEAIKSCNEAFRGPNTKSDSRKYTHRLKCSG